MCDEDTPLLLPSLPSPTDPSCDFDLHMQTKWWRAWTWR
jgi:hypothetical protein